MHMVIVHLRKVGLACAKNHCLRLRVSGRVDMPVRQEVARMTDKQILDMYVNVAEFMALCFSDDVEVVVHDIANLDASVIAIFNNHISNRPVGSPMTDMGRLLIAEEAHKDKNWVVNYNGMTDQGFIVRGSTYFIQNPPGKLIGTLCVNVDVRKYELLKNFADSMITMRSNISAVEMPEQLKTSLDSPVSVVLAAYCARTGHCIDEFTLQDRMDVIADLHGQGFFERKGAISEVAEKLKISEPSAYRYLKAVKKGEAR